jgi:hypothetical protein
MYSVDYFTTFVCLNTSEFGNFVITLIYTQNNKYVRELIQFPYTYTAGNPLHQGNNVKWSFIILSVQSTVICIKHSFCN